MSPGPPAARGRRATTDNDGDPIVAQAAASQQPPSPIPAPTFQDSAAGAPYSSSNSSGGDIHHDPSIVPMQTPFYPGGGVSSRSYGGGSGFPFPYTGQSNVAHGIVVEEPPLGGGAIHTNNSNNTRTQSALLMTRHEGSLMAPLPSSLGCTVDERQERLDSGQCPGCGQLLFKMNGSNSSSSGSGIMKAKFFRRRKESAGKSATMVPLSVPGSVERGQCLRCCLGASSGGPGSAANSTGSLQSSSGSLDWGDLTGATATATTTAAAVASSSLNPMHLSGNNNNSGSSTNSPNPSHYHASRAVSDDSFSDNPEDYGISAAPPPSSLLSSFHNNPKIPPSTSVATATAAAAPAASTSAQQPLQPAGTATYRGPYNEYGERHGRGVMVWTNGDRYEGEFFNGVRHGHGALFFADGSEYVGEWECNYMHGSGTRRFANGDVYVGPYRDGKRSGPDGRFYFANGDLYVGRWQDDVMSGIGRYYYGNGQRFEGRFRDGRRHGPGKFQRVDGSLDQFLYLNDQRSGVGVHWSRQRTKAWRCDAAGNLKKRLTMEEAMTLAYEIDNTDC